MPFPASPADLPTMPSLPVVPPPRLSVVMPVHNAGPFLDQAIASICEQTFADFEFLIWNDGSSDESGELLYRWARSDPRIQLLGDGRRHGPAGSSNLVTRAARAPLIARMDADDIARPDRLRKQVDLLDSKPEAVLVGGLFTMVDEQGRHLRDACFYQRRGSPLRPAFCHPSITFRAAAFDAIGGYRGACDTWEDLDLYLRLAAQGDILIVPDVVIDVRLSGGTTRFREGDFKFEAATDLMFRCMESYRRNGSYEHQLAAAPMLVGKLKPAVYVSSGATALWRGKRPGSLWRMLRGARLRADLGSLTALVWALWAELHPRSLRSVLQAVVRLRNRLAHRSMIEDHLVWRPAAREHAAPGNAGPS
jgi:GT2 family glycosyltransferase